MKLNVSGKLYHVVGYQVRKEDYRVDMEAVERLAKEHRPKVILAGWSAYPRQLDFPEFRRIADEVGAKLFVDMAHFAGLVAAGEHPSPVPYADVVTTTTHKTLGGPRAGLILCKEEYAQAIDKAVFPGQQGGPLQHIIAGKAVCLKIAASDTFRERQRQTIANARAFGEALVEGGLDVLTGGTDVHLVLVDLGMDGLNGKEAEDRLAEVGITVNRNAIPFDQRPPMQASGLRIGTPALTTRGMVEDDMREIGQVICAALDAGLRRLPPRGADGAHEGAGGALPALPVIVGSDGLTAGPRGGSSNDEDLDRHDGACAPGGVPADHQAPARGRARGARDRARLRADARAARAARHGPHRVRAARRRVAARQVRLSCSRAPRAMRKFGRKQGFDLAVGHGSNDLAIAARRLKIPAVNMFDYEWATVQHNIGCRPARRVITPDSIPPERLRRYGVGPDKLAQYPGLKEEYYLADFEPDRTLPGRLGLDMEKVVVVVRPPPDVSLYHRKSNPLFPQVLTHLGRHDGVQAVVLPRTVAQRDYVKSLELPSVVVPESAVDAQTLVALGDLVVSAGGP